MERNRKWVTLVLSMALLLGLSLLLYPTVSNYVNSLATSKAMVDYSQDVSLLNAEAYEKLLREAREYNASLLKRTNEYTLTPEQEGKYHNMLALRENQVNVIGHVEIPSIDVRLPIYHGTSEWVLQNGVGHLDWTSLPIGGESTHAVLSGHRGLPSAELFTKLDQVQAKDIFIIRVLNETMTYEVDWNISVEPGDVAKLTIKEGEDLCTLVTCTPYAKNTHRMLVRGHRIENAPEARTVTVTSEAMQIEPMIVAPLLALPLLFILLVLMLFEGSGKKRARKKE